MEEGEDLNLFRGWGCFPRQQHLKNKTKRKSRQHAGNKNVTNDTTEIEREGGRKKEKENHKDSVVPTLFPFH